MLQEAGVYCGHGYESVIDEALALVLGATGLPPVEPLSLLDQPFPSDAEVPLAALLDRRCRQRLPLAYCLGESYLAGLRFIADPRALVPRSPISHVVAERLLRGGLKVETRMSLWMYAAAAAVWAYRPRPSLVQRLLSDLDPQAISLAAENTTLHSHPDRVFMLRADLLSALRSGSADVVLANPPYVSRGELAELPPEYCHEPRIALEADADGTELAVNLLHDAVRVLAPDGLMLLEVGETWVALENRLPKVPFLWLELPQGGAGVAAISAQELRDWDAAGIL